MRPVQLALALVLPVLLAGCDLLGIEGASVVAARREAEGKAIGGACRHAARSIEACYAENRKSDKAAIFAGWREMNDYMRENKIDAMPAAEVAAGAVDADEGAGQPPAAAPSGGKKPATKPATSEGGKGDAAARPGPARPH